MQKARELEAFMRQKLEEKRLQQKQVQRQKHMDERISMELMKA